MASQRSRGPLHSGTVLRYCTEQGRQNRTESSQRLSGITRQVFNSIFLITDTEVFADRQQMCAWLWEGFYLARNRRSDACLYKDSVSEKSSDWLQQRGKKVTENTLSNCKQTKVTFCSLESGPVLASADLMHKSGNLS